MKGGDENRTFRKSRPEEKMSQRALFAVLFAGLLVACEDDTLLDLNAVRQTKYGLLAGAEYARRTADQAAKKAATARRAADQAVNEAKRAAKVYADQTTRLRRSYNKAAVQAAYDVACAAAYDAAYQAYNDNDGLDDADQDARMIAFAASLDRFRSSDKAKRSAHANYVDSVSGEVAYEVASALFDAAYRADGNDPQAYAAQAYAAAAKKVSRIAARDSVYVKSPISIATAALTASAAAYRASASYIDSVLKFHQIEFSTAAKDHYSYCGRKFGY